MLELLLELHIDGSSGNLPDACVTEMRIVVTSKQEYITKQDTISIFTPFEDSIKTRLENGSFHVIGALEVGASRVATDRTIFMDSLVIKRKCTRDSLTWLTDNVAIDIASDILELSDKLGIVERINTTGSSNSLKNFAPSTRRQQRHAVLADPLGN